MLRLKKILGRQVPRHKQKQKPRNRPMFTHKASVHCAVLYLTLTKKNQTFSTLGEVLRHP